MIYNILYYTILYYTILYYTILYYTILYYTILCNIISRAPGRRSGPRTAARPPPAAPRS